MRDPGVLLPIAVRIRSDADLDACADVARAVHKRDGYPRYLPGDLKSFIASPRAYRAWVAEAGGVIVGHAALHQRASEPVMQVACAATGEPAERLAVVARLLVSPSARGRGAGRALLRAASSEAVARGLWPILDVATDLSGAISLYENCGWVRAGAITFRFSDGNVLDEYVYVGPRPQPHRRSPRPADHPARGE